MLLLLLLAVTQPPDAAREYDLPGYLRIASAYASVNHAAAVREIREWPPAVIEAAVADLRGRAKRLREIPAAPGDIAYGTVEAAVLMHAEAGLLSLQADDLAGAATHLGASVSLFQWTREEARKRAFGQSAGPELAPRLDILEFSVALAAAALATGSPTTAIPFAERARQIAPLDAEVQLVFGCVAEGMAAEQQLRGHESDATHWRDEAALSLMDAIALERGLFPEAGSPAPPSDRGLEARLHLGRLLLEGGRLSPAESRLREVDAGSSDARQRHLARLFLGRLAVRQGRVEDAAAFYRRALEAWPDSQAAHLVLGNALERSSGPAAALPQVAAGLTASTPRGRVADPWRSYLFGPPGLAQAALNRVRLHTLGQ